MQVLEQRDYKSSNPSTSNRNSEPQNEINQSFAISPLPNLMGVSQLLPSLYLCGASVISPQVLAQLGINFVINIAPELPDTPLVNSRNILYLRIYVLDSSHADLSQHFDEVSDMIEEVRQNNGKTLVHCVAGVSRSASLCLAYLMKYSGMNLKDAFLHIKSIRPQIRPNSGFFQQLRLYEEQISGQQSVKMIFMECLQKEIPDVYQAEYQAMEEFYQRQRNSKKRTQTTLTT